MFSAGLGFLLNNKVLKILRSVDTQNDHIWQNFDAPQKTLWQNFRFSAFSEGFVLKLFLLSSRNCLLMMQNSTERSR